MATAHSKFGEESQETRAEMANEASTQTHHVEDVEIQEWLESLDSVLEASGRTWRGRFWKDCARTRR